MSSPQMLADALSLELLDVVADRRGSWLLKVRRDNTVHALKGFDPSVSDTYDRQALLEHEAQLLRDLGDIVGGQYVDHGSHVSFGSWLLMRWVGGEAASDASVRIVSGDTSKEPHTMRDLFKFIVRSYVAIHEAGFLHADVQPRHSILEPANDRATILDWGLGRRVNGKNLPFKGSFVHYAAPEVASAMLAQQTDIPYVLSSEIYSLGAVLYICYTRQTAVDYGPGPMTSIPLQTKLQAVTDSQLRPFPEAKNRDEEHLQRVITICLNRDPSKRYESSRALLQALEHRKDR